MIHDIIPVTEIACGWLWYENIWYDVGMASDVHLYTNVDQFNRCAKIMDHMTYTKIKHQIVS